MPQQQQQQQQKAGSDSPRHPLLLADPDRSRRSRSRQLVTAAAVSSIIILAFAAIVGVCFVKFKEVQGDAGRWPGDSYVSDAKQLEFQHNVVVADSPACGAIGGRILNQLGGSAMDAAVATVLCEGASSFHSAGIGGGSFILHFDGRSRRVSSIDSRETAPLSSSSRQFANASARALQRGPLSVATPGELAGLQAAHAKFGRLPWRQLVTPTAELLRRGQPVTPALAKAMAQVWPRLPREAPYQELRRWLRSPTGADRPYAAGETLKDHTLAATFDIVAEKGASAFYSGQLASRIAAELATVGAAVTPRDLRRYAPVERQPVTVAVATGLRLHAMPPPSSGAVVAFVLSLLADFPLKEATAKAAKATPEGYALFLHRFVEALKFAFARRSALGDPAFVADSADALRRLVDPVAAADARRRVTDNATHGVDFYGGSFAQRSDAGTVHVSVVAADGSAAAVTSTINSYFGSLLRGSSTGIIYNNEMADFSQPRDGSQWQQPPSRSNGIQPGKRPMSSMSPVFVTDAENRLKFVAGGAGGAQIVSAVAFTLARLVFFNDSVKEALDAARLHHQLVPNEIFFSEGLPLLPQPVIDGLRQRGHRFRSTADFSVVQAAHVLPRGRLQACGDFRKEAAPVGL